MSAKGGAPSRAPRTTPGTWVTGHESEPLTHCGSCCDSSTGQRKLIRCSRDTGKPRFITDRKYSLAWPSEIILIRKERREEKRENENEPTPGKKAEGCRESLYKGTLQDTCPALDKEWHTGLYRVSSSGQRCTTQSI